MRTKNWMQYADDDDKRILALLNSRLNRKKAAIEAEITPKINLIRLKCIQRMRRANGKNGE